MAGGTWLGVGNPQAALARIILTEYSRRGACHHSRRTAALLPGIATSTSLQGEIRRSGDRVDEDLQRRNERTSEEKGRTDLRGLRRG